MSLPGSGSSGALRLFAINGIPVSFSSSYLFLLFFWGMRGGLYAPVHVVTLTVSVLVHEFGHALVAQRYRLRPSIVLHGLGGYCTHAPATKRNHDLAISAGGPAAGLALGLAAWAVSWVVPPGADLLRVVTWDLVWLGIFWSIVNLVPILPLDGGHIALNLVERRRSISRPNLLVRAASVGMAVLAGVVLDRLAGGWGLLLLGYLGAVNAWELRWISNPFNRQEVSRWSPAATALVVGIALTMLPSLFARADSALALSGDGLPTWQLLTYPLAPGPMGGWVAAMVGCAVAAPPLERRVGPGWVVLLSGLATIVSGAVFVGLPGAGPLMGAGPIALALLGAWAVNRERRVAAGLVWLALTGAALVDRDLARVGAWLVAFGLGVAFTLVERRFGGESEGRAKKYPDNPPPIRW